ncbi:hypothetical protein NPIL_175401 [Nephila pilipes]|uniref:Uncharacterized protein n=1 Tax=Nephila pilipes TaxID=299642 RepID=A0A8X6UI28_NEPPI|nr:hypothetical protein NPIL_175401 [Nephila pilipes]
MMLSGAKPPPQDKGKEFPSTIKINTKRKSRNKGSDPRNKGHYRYQRHLWYQLKRKSRIMISRVTDFDGQTRVQFMTTAVKETQSTLQINYRRVKKETIRVGMEKLFMTLQ